MYVEYVDLIYVPRESRGVCTLLGIGVWEASIQSIDESNFISGIIPKYMIKNKAVIVQETETYSFWWRKPSKNSNQTINCLQIHHSGIGIYYNKHTNVSFDRI